MRVSIVDVNTDIRHIFDNLLRAIETSGTTPYHCEAVLLIRLNLVLIFDLLSELIVVILGIIEPKTAVRHLLEM